MPDFNERDEAEASVAIALASLPLHSPPANQFARIALELARRKRVRMQKRVALFAVAAVIAVAAIVPFARMAAVPGAARSNEVASANVESQAATTSPSVASSSSTNAADASPNVDLIARNQWLEAMVRAQGEPLDAASAYASAGLEDLIGMVDVQLSGTDEPSAQTALWEQRIALMQELASVRSQGLAVVTQDTSAGLMPANYQID